MATRIINPETVTDVIQLVMLLNAMQTEIDALRTVANELKTDMSAHTHGGAVAAGATIAAAAVAQQAKKSL